MLAVKIVKKMNGKSTEYYLNEYIFRKQNKAKDKISLLYNQEKKDIEL